MPRQRAAARRQPPPVHVGEHVVPGSFGNRAGQVTEHHQVGVVVIGVQQGQIQVQPVIVLDRRVHALRRDASDLADPHACPRFLLVGAADPDERHGVAVEHAARGAQVTAARRHPAACARHGHVGFPQADVADAPMHDGLYPGAVVPGIEPQPGHAGGEPVQMGIEPVEPPLPDVYHVIRAVRTGHAQIEHRDFRVLDGAVPPVHPGCSGRPRRRFAQGVRARSAHSFLLVSSAMPGSAGEGTGPGPGQYVPELPTHHRSSISPAHPWRTQRGEPMRIGVGLPG